MPEAQCIACACFPIWNSHSRLHSEAKPWKRQGSPLPYVCAGKGEEGIQGTEGTPDIGLPADQTASLLSRRFHYWPSPPPASSKERLEVAAAKAAGNRMGGKARGRGRIERPTRVMRKGR